MRKKSANLTLAAALNNWHESDKMHSLCPLILFLGLFRYMYPDRLVSVDVACMQVRINLYLKKKKQFDISR